MSKKICFVVTVSLAAKNFLEWSEGNRYLYELLCSCWENGITTFASCGGHEQKNGSPYLGMIINDNSLPFIKNILAQGW